MSDEEPDYLSDDFLAQCIPKDVRPGLLYQHGQKRKHDLLKQQEKDNADNRKKNKPHRELEKERREEGLNKAIGADNKGFQMLARMGFKPGSSLGQPRSSSGPGTSSTQPIKEPVQIVIKSDRKGLGEKTKNEEKRLQIEEWKQQRDQLSDPSEYRKRIRDDVMLKEINGDLRQSQSACKTLDNQCNVMEPIEPWFWPKVIVVKDEDEEDTEEVEEKEPEVLPEPRDQLETLTCYLRLKYFYCIWCGTNYADAKDLEDSCPGDTRQDH